MTYLNCIFLQQVLVLCMCFWFYLFYWLDFFFFGNYCWIQTFVPSLGAVDLIEELMSADSEPLPFSHCLIVWLVFCVMLLNMWQFSLHAQAWTTASTWTTTREFATCLMYPSQTGKQCLCCTNEEPREALYASLKTICRCLPPFYCYYLTVGRLILKNQSIHNLPQYCVDFFARVPEF